MLGWIIFAIDWGIVLALLPLIMRKPRPAVKLAWIAVIFAVPIAGAAFYLFIGESRFGHARVRKRGEVKKLINLVKRSEMVAPHIVAPRIRSEHLDLALLTERLGDLPVLGGNGVSMLGGGDEMIESLIGDIEQAKDHVHLMYYIYAGDRTGFLVAGALRKAAARGVACRVLADDAGSRSTFSKVEAHLIEGGVQVRRMLPASIFRVPFRRIDVRNHRKLAVVDGKVAYVGSQNIVDAISVKRSSGECHDLTVRVKGPAVMALQMTFLDDWLAETGEKIEDDLFFPKPASESGIAVQIVRSGPPYPAESFSHVIVAAIHEASERVTITTPYFVPDEPTFSALRIVALRGVKVEIVVPRRSDSVIVDAAARACFDLLLDVGVHLYRHAPGMLHSKTLAVDDSFALIGSSNLDQRSFGLNYELNVLLFGPKVTEQLRVHQDRYLSQSARIVAETWRRRPMSHRVLDSVASLFSPLL